MASAPQTMLSWQERVVWPNGADGERLRITIEVRETPPQPDHVAPVVLAEWNKGERQGPRYWKQHIEDLLKIEAMLIQKGYRNLREFIYEQGTRVRQTEGKIRQIKEC